MASLVAQLIDLGQSPWLDYIQRGELQDGTLARMIAEDGVRGVTSNPTIFMNAVSSSSDYDAQISALAGAGASPAAIYDRITVDDICAAADLFLPLYTESFGSDGYVSIELNPQHAFDVARSLAEAREIVQVIGRPNIMVKVPGTEAGLGVIQQLLTEGINVNVTLLFNPERYRQVAQTYIDALAARYAAGNPIDQVHSVASFFISRIDTQVDRQLDAAADQEAARQLRGQAALNVGRVVYSIFQDLFGAEGFARLAAQGASVQRVLWASTGTKDPAYSDVKYVDSLIGPDTINTMPPKAMAAFRDHGTGRATIDEGRAEAPAVLERIAACGVDLAAIYQQLETDGVAAFEKSYLDLLASIEAKSKALAQ